MNAIHQFALERAAVSNAIHDACITDIRAFKPGNVSAGSPGHGMQADDFIASATAMAREIAAPMADVGERILRAVEATRSVVSVNTNLGIILLCAPLVHAATARMAERRLRVRLHAVLVALDVYDAELAYRAIRLAAPGGLGRADRHDVAQSPSVTLSEAMNEARERDRIAYQYVSDFEDIFETALPALRETHARWRSRDWAAVYVYLVMLARFLDSLIVRKHGVEVAADVSRQAADLESALARVDDPSRELPALEAFDRQLKAKSINPGTTADLTVAALVAMDLEDSLEKLSPASRAGSASG
ncbi:MAG TPA: triphosphoribosyl-dephospho-CoA synthase [Burkholderiales bacterium]|nr:triphosphoribosyl-dephospho-CoA synthase [Burkholderiales bacterium]